jgi:hypothetical protein
MKEITNLFQETRKWRLDYREKGQKIEAAACAIREKALLDAMMALGMPVKDAERLRKI